MNDVEPINENDDKFIFSENKKLSKTKTIKRGHGHRETPVWRKNHDGSLHGHNHQKISNHQKTSTHTEANLTKKKKMLEAQYQTHSSPTNIKTTWNNKYRDIKKNKKNQINSNGEREKGKQSSLPLPKSSLTESMTMIEPLSPPQTKDTNNNKNIINNNINNNIPFYKKEIVSKTDKSFWPYYRLISDISRCNSHQLLDAIDNIYGLDSLQQVLSAFMINKLRDSLSLESIDLLYLPPKELMRDNDNNIFISTRNNVPSTYHPSFLDLNELRNEYKSHSPFSSSASESSYNTNNSNIKSKHNLQLVVPPKKTKTTKTTTNDGGKLPVIHSPNETDAKLDDKDNFDIKQPPQQQIIQQQQNKKKKNKTEVPTPINPNASSPSLPNNHPPLPTNSSASTPSTQLAHSVTSPTGGKAEIPVGAEIFDIDQNDEKVNHEQDSKTNEKLKFNPTDVSITSMYSNDTYNTNNNGNITPYNPNNNNNNNNNNINNNGDMTKLENIMIKDSEIGYRIISYLDQKSFITAHTLSRIFLYCCRLPKSRSHLMIRVGKVADKMPISVSEFLKNRMSMLLNIRLLHLVIDRPKWDVLKILLSKLTQLRQLDLMLPALQANYIMPTKMLNKSCKMLELTVLRISGPRKLKLSQQYPDISFLLRDFLKKIKMPKLTELWLMRVASKEKNTIKKFLNEYKSTLKSLEFELSISMNNSLTMLKEVNEYAKDITPSKTPLKSLSFRLIRDPIGLFTYQQNKLDDNKNKTNNKLDDNKDKNGSNSNNASPLSLIGAMNLRNTSRLNASYMNMKNDQQLYKKILDENEFKIRTLCAKIVNEFSDKVCFERLVYPGNVGKIHWNAINRLQTLRNLHIIIQPSDMLQGLDELCTQCGHTLTNLKLTVHGIGNDSDTEKMKKSKNLSVFKIEQDLLYHLNKNLRECTKLRHVRLVIGDYNNNNNNNSNNNGNNNNNKKNLDNNANEIGRVSIDSLCSFMIQHSSTLSTIELHCYYLTFDLDKLKENQSGKNGVSSKFYIPDVKQELQERLEDLFFSCNHLKRIRIQHVTSHRKFVAVQRLFHGKPHTVGVENLDHFVENQFL